MEKKGQGVQFNWIFVIVAGGLILLFFMFFTARYFELHNLRVGSETARGLDQVFLSAKSTPQYKTFNLEGNNFDLNFECGFFVIDGNYRQEIDYVLFGTDVSDTDELLIWSREFNKPFKVDNVVYVLDTRKKIYVEGNLEFLQGLPDDLNIASNANDADSLVFFDYCPSGYDGKKKVCVVNNQISFDGETYNYYDDYLVYAALVSDQNNFECAVERLEKKWSNLFKIYSRKIEFMSGCNSLFSNLKSELDDASNYVLSGNGINNEDSLINLNRNLVNADCGVVF
jgi:hypothetical protein